MDHIGIKKKQKGIGDRQSGMRSREKRLRAEVSAAAGFGSAEKTDPVQLLTQNYRQTFDAAGKARAAELSNQRSGALQRDDLSASGSSSGRDTAERNSSDNTISGLRKKHDFPEYSHSERQLSEGSFCDRFSANAFRGGKLAGAVLEGQAKNMFITCVQRARTVRPPSNDKQRKILGSSAVERGVDGEPASVVFNRDIRSAVGIAVDAVHGASRVFDIFKDIADGTGDLQDNPLEIRGVGTIRSVYPFLSTEADKSLIQKYRSRLKSLENDNSAEAAQEKQSIGSALKKAEAVLERKEAEKRKFLTKLSEMQSNAREAENLFSSEGFAEAVQEEIEATLPADPPDDNRRRRRTIDQERVNGPETASTEQAAAEPADTAESEIRQ